MKRIDVYEPVVKLVNSPKISKSLLKTLSWLNSNIQRHKKLSHSDVRVHKCNQI